MIIKVLVGMVRGIADGGSSRCCSTEGWIFFKRLSMNIDM